MNIDWGISMKLFKRVITTFSFAVIGMAMSLPQAANAGDRRVIVGTRHMQVIRHAPPATIVTQYPNTVIYGRTPRVIYQGAPTVVIASPFINARPYNYYRNWNRGWRNGWRNQSMRQGQPRYCPPNRRPIVGHYRGYGQRRW